MVWYTDVSSMKIVKITRVKINFVMLNYHTFRFTLLAEIKVVHGMVFGRYNINLSDGLKSKISFFSKGILSNFKWP